MPALAAEHLGRLTAVTPEVARAAGYRLVVLFGSAARGRPDPEDLDLGILADGLVDTVAAANRFIEALHTQHVDIVDLRTADPLLAAVVARDASVLYEARPGEFARFVSLAYRRYADTQRFRRLEHESLRRRIAALQEAAR
jgi:predicted nucleotidyltransferase